MKPRPVGSSVKLRVAFGEVPPVPSVLILPSGRRYDVIEARGKTLHCIVMRPDAEVTEDDGPVLAWMWAPRKRRVATSSRW